MDPFPFPRINLLVDETAGCALLSFIDALRGYHKIFMHEADEEKTAFITPDGVFCYLVMAFRLKNLGDTYIIWWPNCSESCSESHESLRG